MALQITITNPGRAEIINAQNTGTAPVVITEIGFGSGQYDPINKDQVALVSEIKRVSSIAGLAAADDTIHVVAKDESSDIYDVGEFGLFSASGTLIAFYSQPVGEGWIIEKSVSSTLLLAIDLILETLDAASVTFGDVGFVNPPATDSVSGVVKLATAAQLTGGAVGSLAVPPAVLKPQLDEKAPLESPALTGNPTAPTQALGNNTTRLANTAFVQAAIAALVASSPAALDTLNELAAALGNDPNFATTITNALAAKQPLDATLNGLAALSTTANQLIYATGANTFAMSALTAFARALLDDGDAAAARNTLDVPSRGGSGAGGTWPINITGSAAWAGSAGNADTVDGWHVGDILNQFGGYLPNLQGGNSGQRGYVQGTVQVTSFTLPAGGSYFVFGVGHRNSDGALTSRIAGYYAGGTLIVFGQNLGASLGHAFYIKVS